MNPMSSRRGNHKQSSLVVTYTVAESEVQSGIVEFLQITGFTVLVTNAAVRKVAATAGLPDLLVTKNTWPRFCWLGLEIKRPEVRIAGQIVQKKGCVRLEQQALADAGRVAVVDSIDETKEAVEAFECGLIGYLKPYELGRNSFPLKTGAKK